MRFPRRRGSTAHGMTVKRYTTRLLATACVLGLGLTLGSCGGYVADHWPHWAGGMPDDVPPRPGAPGYDEFIAHGEADQMPAKPVTPDAATAATARPHAGAPGPKPAVAATEPVFQQTVAPPAEPANDQPAGDSSVVKGGLY
jgi:hypothetical protein